MIQAEFQRCQLRLQALRQTYHQAGNEEQLAVAWRLEALLYQVLLEAEEAGPAQTLERLQTIRGHIDQLDSA